MGVWDSIKSGAGWAEKTFTPFGHGELTDDEKNRQRLLQQQAATSGGFADTGQQGFAQLGQESQGTRDYLARVGRGDQSIAAEQLHQGVQQLQAGQNSMAASASPQNGPMAARTAAIQSAHLGSGLAGQQAMAGIAERRAAMEALAQMQAQQQQQQMQAALQGRQNAMTGYGAGQPFQTQPTFGQQFMGAIGGAAGMYATKK